MHAVVRKYNLNHNLLNEKQKKNISKIGFEKISINQSLSNIKYKMISLHYYVCVNKTTYNLSYKLAKSQNWYDKMNHLKDISPNATY